MEMITDIFQITVNDKNQLLYDGKKIDKWWGRTLVLLTIQNRVN